MEDKSYLIGNHTHNFTYAYVCFNRSLHGKRVAPFREFFLKVSTDVTSRRLGGRAFHHRGKEA